MTRSIDLHTHTVYSDGSMTPAALVRRASRYGIRTLAITDHGTFAGFVAAQQPARTHRVRLISGIELAATLGPLELHLLGYALRSSDAGLQRLLGRIAALHRTWFRQCCAVLVRRGFALHPRVLQTTRAVLPGHDVLVAAICAAAENHRRLRKDFGTITPELFTVINAYCFGAHPIPKRPVAITAARALRAIHDAGGVAVLAHPGRTLTRDVERTLGRLRSMGLDGIEALTPNHTWHDVVRFQRLAARHRLFVTAGSDTHEFLAAPFLTRLRWQYFHSPLTRLPWERR